MDEESNGTVIDRLTDEDSQIMGLKPMYFILLCVVMLMMSFCAMSMMGTMTMRGGYGGYGGGYGGYGGGYGGGYW